MENLIIKNKENSVEIDLFGDVGDYWGEITVDRIKNILNENKKKDILFRVSSLGGSANAGFVIHDMLKMHKGNVTTQIIGATASAGTLIALGADNVQMSENALFLIHNVWTLAIGNADELRKEADNLDKWDDVAINIYRKKTGRSHKFISDLMAEEKWISAKEAEKYGFVDLVFQPQDSSAKMQMSVEKFKEFGIPELNNDQINLIKNQNVMAIENQVDNVVEVKDEKTFLSSLIAGIKEAFTSNNTAANAGNDDPRIGELQSEVESIKLAKLETDSKLASAQAELVQANADLDEQKSKYITLEAENVNLKSENEQLKDENTKLLSGEIIPKKSQDTSKIGELTDYQKSLMTDAASLAKTAGVDVS